MECIDKQIDNIKYKLSTQLATYRQDNNLTQREMADLCKTAQSTYSQIERGVYKKVTIDYLVRMNYLAKTGLKLITLAE